MTHEDYKEMLAANAIHALDPDETSALTPHLQGCNECQLETERWHETVAPLALAADPIEPPAHLRQQILQRVRGEKISPISDSRYQNVVSFERPARNVWTSLGSAGAIAAGILLVGLSISLLVLWRQYRSTQTELDVLTAQMRETNTQLARERAVVALLTSPGSRMAELSGTNSAPGAHAMIAYDKHGHAMLMAKGLPEAPAGMAYQLWFIMDGRKMPGKVFTTNASGNGEVEDQIPAVAIGKAIFAITLEPESGVQVPTGAVYLVSSS